MLSATCSTLTALGQKIDCRQLTLSCQFFDLSQDEMICFLFKTKQWIQSNLLQNAYACWKVNEKQVSLRNFEKHIKEATTLISMVSWEVEAFINSPLVYNQARCRDVLKKLHFLFMPTTADDFKPYWDSIFPNGRCENDALIQGIHKVFREENRYLKTTFFRPDIFAFFYSVPCRTNCGMYEGSFVVSMPVAFMGESVNYIAESLLRLLKSLGSEFRSVNGHVMLQPYQFPAGNSPYMYYFGQHYLGEDFCEDRDGTSQKWYQRYYLTGVEWGNLLSPIAVGKLKDGGGILANKNELQIERLDNGSLLVKSAKGIDKYCVEDAMVLKQYLLPALYPGGSYRRLRDIFCQEESYDQSCWPRADWAIVPVLDGEIKVIGTDLVFCSKRI